MAKILIVGCGAVGTLLATTLSANKHQVVGLKRTLPESHQGIIYITADISNRQQLDQLDNDFDYLIFMVSADSRTEASYRRVYQTGLDNILSRFQHIPIFFVSSTSVYGQINGEWVDENSDTRPASITSQLICLAEQRVLAVNTNNIIVRFSGIYGPGREYLLRMAQQSESVQHTPPYYTNRIHQQDCVGVLTFLLEQHLSGVKLQSCYLATDNHSATLWEVMSWLKQQMNVAAPTMKNLSEDAEQNKRCSNQRLQQLGYQFIFPDYQQGYSELIRHE